ncbi:MAG TPA: DUF4920 domain-containing protein [Thermoanaerobaculia bacterium]|nr:DUF4920 domain-containing protein [Thermoanaerobaculia bacterium]
MNNLSIHAVSRQNRMWMSCLAVLAFASTLSAAEVIQRGAAVPAKATVIPLASVLANPESFTETEFVTEGTVRRVCRFAGCWMIVAPAGSSAGLRVMFKGGAFVVPRSSGDSHARILGRVRITKDKVTFVASGVEITAKSK